MEIHSKKFLSLVPITYLQIFHDAQKMLGSPTASPKFLRPGKAKQEICSEKSLWPDEEIFIQYCT